jgi:hypothetical protein
MRLQRAFLKSSGRGLDHFVKPREVIIKDPEYLISQIYDGHDVRTSMGLRAWQLSTISLCTNDKTYRTQLALKAVKKKIGAEGKAALENAEREINIISQSMVRWFNHPYRYEADDLARTKAWSITINTSRSRQPLLALQRRLAHLWSHQNDYWQ